MPPDPVSVMVLYRIQCLRGPGTLHSTESGLEGLPERGLEGLPKSKLFHNFPATHRATLGTLSTPTMLGSVVVMVPKPRLPVRAFRVRLAKNEFPKRERQGNRAREREREREILQTKKAFAFLGRVRSISLRALLIHKIAIVVRFSSILLAKYSVLGPLWQAGWLAAAGHFQKNGPKNSSFV